jgi:iron complex outermembrane receptor protein
MIRESVLVLGLCLPLLVGAQETETHDNLTALLDMDLETLGTLVYTADRELTAIEEAPSVVTVITSEQIEQHGLKSIYEVLARVPGFFNSTSAFMEPVSNRGFAQNVNTNYLLLVDGHALNNDAINGLGHAHMMPSLDSIARIEVVRGPSSTLWGANAAMGIIHLITKEAGELDNGDNLWGTLQVSYDYEFDHQRNVAQATYGKQFDEGGIMLSGKFFNSAPDWTTSYQAGATDFEVQTSRQMNLWDFEDSYDLYGKANWRDLTFKVGKIRFKNFNPLFTPVDNSTVDNWVSKKQWFEVGGEQALSENFSLEWTLFHDEFEEERFIKRAPATPEQVFTSTQTSRADGLSGEAIVHFRNQAHHLLLGISASNMDLSLNTVQRFTNDVVKEFVTVPMITDKNRAVFIEESYRDIKDWVFTLGLRVDHNKPRAHKINYLPRAAASYLIDENWSVKYTYNTGYVAPTLEQTRGGIYQQFDSNKPAVKGAEDSQKSRAHDIQWFYSDDSNKVDLTLFHHTLTDVIQFSGFGPIPLGGISKVRLLEVNASDMVTWGLELEAESRLTNSLNLYGNYALANAEYQDRFVFFKGEQILDLVTGTSVATEDGTVTGTPQHIWNMGVDWQIKEDLTFNIHYRGWTDALAKNSDQPTFKRFGPEHYIDLNLLAKNIFTKNLTISAYIKNVFDNRHPLPSGVNEGQVEPQNGRQLGIKLSYLFK